MVRSRTPESAAPPSEAAPAPLAKLGYSRDNPDIGTLVQRRRLNREGSEKETWHIELDLAGTDLDYEVGDSLGIFPINDPELVDSVIAALGAPPDFPIGGRTLRETSDRQRLFISCTGHVVPVDFIFDRGGST